MRLATVLILLGVMHVSFSALFSYIGTDPGVCKTYHEMRHTYEATDGEYGWPEGAVRGCVDE